MTSYTVSDERREAWSCYRCGSNRSVGYGMWPNSGPVKAQCVPCGAVSDWPDEPTTAPRSDEGPHETPTPTHHHPAALTGAVTTSEEIAS